MVVVLVVAAKSTERADTPLHRAQRLVGNTSNFDTGREAGDTLVFAATALLKQARTCVAARGESPYCLAFRSAAAWSNVAGVKALTCRAPGRFTLQRTAIDFYAQLEALPTTVRRIPLTPPLPECG